MNYPLIIAFLLIAIGFLLLAFLYKTGRWKLNKESALPKEDLLYWEQTTKKIIKGFFVAAVGAAITAITLSIKSALPAEIGCITLLSASVFTLAVLCRKTGFRPNDATLSQQKKWKTIFLFFSFLSLFMTQLVFQYFNSLLLQVK